MKFLFNYASRSRPDNFFRGLDSIKDNFSDENTYHIIASLDTDDATMNTPEVIEKMDFYGVEHHFGVSQNKIHAINREIRHFGRFNILVNFSDDMIFTVKDFDKIIIEKFGEDLDKFLHFRDTNHKQPDALCTLSIMGTTYFDRDNFVYDPNYVSVYCDNWAQFIAKKRKKYFYFSDVIFDHIHPAYGKCVRDEQYNRTEDRKIYKIDRITYAKMVKSFHHYL